MQRLQSNLFPLPIRIFKMKPDSEQIKIQISKINVQHQSHKLQPKSKEIKNIPIVFDINHDQIWTKNSLKIQQLKIEERRRRQPTKTPSFSFFFRLFSFVLLFIESWCGSWLDCSAYKRMFTIRANLTNMTPIDECSAFSVLWKPGQRYYKPRCGEWPQSGRTIYIEHHSFLGIEVLPSSQLSAVSMATRVSRSVFWIRKHGDARKSWGDFGSLLISSIYSIYEIK